MLIAVLLRTAGVIGAEGFSEVLLSVDDLEGLEMTLAILGDSNAVALISESVAALARREPGADMAAVRQDLAQRRVTGA